MSNKSINRNIIIERQQSMIKELIVMCRIALEDGQDYKLSRNVKNQLLEIIARVTDQSLTKEAVMGKVICDLSNNCHSEICPHYNSHAPHPDENYSHCTLFPYHVTRKCISTTL